MTVDVLGVSIPVDAGILLGGFVLVAAYLYLGKAFVGPDDNYWGPIRRTVLPRLDRVLHEYGGYARGTADRAEFVGVVDATPERVERFLWAVGYLWNFAASLKTSPDGVVEYSSWAKRRVQRPGLRAMFEAVERIPVLGVAPEIVESIVATRQVHVTLFEREDGRTAVYSHEEPNALNPLLFVAHYTGGARDSLLGRDVAGQRDDLGAELAARDLQGAGAPLDVDSGVAARLDAANAGDGNE